MEIRVGQSASITRTVTQADTAQAVGSGDLPVLGTPVLLAWLEAATVAACGPDDSETTVGTRIGIDHSRASAVGAVVTCTAEVAEVDGRLITFTVKATQQSGGEDVVVGDGVVTRAVVDRSRFMARLASGG